MKLTKSLLLILSVIIISCSKDFTGDINELRDLYEKQSVLLTQLQKGLAISKYEENEDGYVLTFSDGKTITLKNAQAPIVKIGANNNWVINGVDTGISAIGTDGTNGKDGANGKDAASPTVEIKNGNWFINGIDTGVQASSSDGKNGYDAPYIISTVVTNENIIFNFSDGSTVESKILTKKFVVSWGDSLTWGPGTDAAFTGVIKNLVNNSSYDFYNFGVGGENSIEIAARQGGIPMYLGVRVELPADNTPVVIGNLDQSNLFSSWNDKAVKPLLRNPTPSNNSINDCVIDGVSVVLKWTGKSFDDKDGTYTIQRSVKSDKPSVIKSGSILYTSSMRNYRDAYANIFFIGQNRGYENIADLTAQIKAMINFSSSSNYLVVGLTSGDAQSRKSLETLMTREFGARYVNLRKYLSTEGIYDAGITPTEADLASMEIGEVPPSLRYDYVHFTAKGHELIGNYLYKHFTYLGVF